MTTAARNAPQVTGADVAIVGGGLTGLALAERLHNHGRDVLVLEARDRFGGRALTEHHAGAALDLGPSWFWPGQPRIAALLDRFGLDAFEQHVEGALAYEDEGGSVRHIDGLAPMAGALRVPGGVGAIVDKIVRSLPLDRLLTDAPVTKIEAGDSIGPLTLRLDGRAVVRAARVVLAVPPRLVARIALDPALDRWSVDALGAVPTWMAGHAKFAAVYPTPFWRRAGLNGSAVSRRGPLMEIHDASPPDGSRGALFGFVGVPAHVRVGHGAELEALALDQLVRLFGAGAGKPLATRLVDWANDPLTTTPADLRPLTGHPSYGPLASPNGAWTDRLLVASSELAPHHGGLLEGALEAAASATYALVRHVAA